jgi:oxygen-independent coproporphyrinogen-3 oxidase
MIDANLKSVLFRLFAGMPGPPLLTGDTPPTFEVQEVGLYLHVPFCRSLCPFCPYNRMRYSADLYARFEHAVYREVERYLPMLAGCRVTSLYIGGGTPTVDAEGLVRLVGHIRGAFPGKYQVAVELHPTAAGPDVLSSLRAVGVSQVSVGVQSLADGELRRIGRNHDAAAARRALHDCLEAGFTVNADLMFALPDQDDESWRQTLVETLRTGVHEISTYPIFSFPYTLPNAAPRAAPRRAPEKTLRRQLEIARCTADSEGFKRSTVWSWTRPGAPPFSSVTRHCYVGLGPGAASMTGSSFYVNTFSVSEYANAVASRLPIALAMRVPQRLDRAYWLYWSLYALHVSRSEFAARFEGRDLSREFGMLLRPMRMLGWLDKDAEGYKVTNAGAYWIHRLQNAYSLRYLERLWGACLREPWPKEVHL